MQRRAECCVNLCGLPRPSLRHTRRRAINRKRGRAARTGAAKLGRGQRASRGEEGAGCGRRHAGGDRTRRPNGHADARNSNDIRGDVDRAATGAARRIGQAELARQRRAEADARDCSAAWVGEREVQRRCAAAADGRRREGCSHGGDTKLIRADVAVRAERARKAALV